MFAYYKIIRSIGWISNLDIETDYIYKDIFYYVVGVRIGYGPDNFFSGFQNVQMIYYVHFVLRVDRYIFFRVNNFFFFLDEWR